MTHTLGHSSPHILFLLTLIALITWIRKINMMLWSLACSLVVLHKHILSHLTLVPSVLFPYTISPSFLNWLLLPWLQISSSFPYPKEFPLSLLPFQVSVSSLLPMTTKYLQNFHTAYLPLTLAPNIYLRWLFKVIGILLMAKLSSLFLAFFLLFSISAVFGTTDHPVYY